MNMNVIATSFRNVMNTSNIYIYIYIYMFNTALPRSGNERARSHG